MSLRSSQEHSVFVVIVLSRHSTNFSLSRSALISDARSKARDGHENRNEQRTTGIQPSKRRRFECWFRQREENEDDDGEHDGGGGSDLETKAVILVCLFLGVLFITGTITIWEPLRRPGLYNFTSPLNALLNRSV